MVKSVIYGQLDQEEFNRRCCEVFDSEEGEVFCDITVEACQGHVLSVCVNMEDADGLSWPYYPDMGERPQALDYLLGNRATFND